jgi:hypothetical protein
MTCCGLKFQHLNLQVNVLFGTDTNKYTVCLYDLYTIIYIIFFFHVVFMFVLQMQFFPTFESFHSSLSSFVQFHNPVVPDHTVE